MVKDVILQLATWGHLWAGGYTSVGHVGEPTNTEIQGLVLGKESPVIESKRRIGPCWEKWLTKQRHSVGVSLPGMLLSMET